MVYVQLDDEEKLQVLLLALALFLLAIATSICLVVGCCPLNRWLLARHSQPNQRRQQRSSPRSYHKPPPPPLGHRQPLPGYLVQVGNHFGWPTASGKSGRDPRSTATAGAAYIGPPPAYEAALRATRLQSLSAGPPEWPAEPPGHPEKQTANLLDFGDYFHAPKEAGELPAVFVPIATNLGGASEVFASAAALPGAPRPPPVMLRLWVRVLDPGELVWRAAGQQHQRSSSSGQARLSRQLSIPHLFGSLVSLASGGGGKTLAQETSGQPESLEVINSEENSSSGSSSLAKWSSLTQTSCQESSQGKIGMEASERCPSWPPSLAAIASPVTSRVLHMNVASFSYVKDETLISTKLHLQLNEQQLSPTALKQPPESAASKMCQLVISICDLENLVSACWLQRRSCALLTSSSAIYVQCEILAPQTVIARRLLRCPLLAIKQQPSADTHTLDFGGDISAAALERPLPVVSSVTSSSNGNDNDNDKQSELEGSTTTTEHVALQVEAPKEVEGGIGGRPTWRHEPAADGRSVVTFASVPKQVELQQAPPLATMEQHQNQTLSSQGQQQQQQAPLALGPDLIQFDSVFVSPILQRSAIEEGYLRLRIYSQSPRHLNQSCLAELKLPLKHLLRNESGDNLADAQRAQELERARQQADLILDRLLINLVTASTGEPLAQLIEQHQQQQPLSQQQLRPTCSFQDSLCRLEEANRVNQEDQEEEDQQQQARSRERLEQNYRRSLLVSHWLNYLVAPAYECQLVEESLGQLTLGLSYLPTSNRIIFNAYRATIEERDEGKRVKRLRLHSNTCYLVRFLMLVNGRVVKRKQTPVASRPEWDQQEPITFDLVSVSVEQPAFVVCLVMRNPAANRLTGSLQNLHHKHLSTSSSSTCMHSPLLRSSPNSLAPPHVAQCAQSEPESLFRRQQAATAVPQTGLEPCAACLRSGSEHQATPGGRLSRHGDLVIGHATISDQVWHEMRAQPRKQIVRQFKLL